MVVDHPSDTQGYRASNDMCLDDLEFEVVNLMWSIRLDTPTLN